MKPPLGPPPRLRDTVDPELRRAAALVRAMPSPAPLGARAEARVRAALGARFERGGWHPWRRAFAPVAAMLALVATGAGAVAGVAWMRRERAPMPVVTPAPRAVPTPAPSEAPRPRIAIEESPTPRPRGRVRATPRAFVRPELAIDPYDRSHRPALSPELARVHAGRNFEWKVKICVGRDGAVTTVGLVDHQHPAIDRELTAALRGWRYHPATRGGRAVPACLGLAYRLQVAAAGAEPPSENPRNELRDQTD